MILISGAARANGQGASEARVLAQAGATVYFSDILLETVTQTARTLGSAVHYRHLDVTAGSGLAKGSAGNTGPSWPPRRIG